MSSSSTNRTATDLGNVVRLSPLTWPAKAEVQPGDFSRFARNGESIYAYGKPRDYNPYAQADMHSCTGNSVLFLDNDMTRDDLDVLMRILQVQGRVPEHKFAAFMTESETPGRDRYLTQLRLVPASSLRSEFGAREPLAASEDYLEQPLSMVDALWEFMKQERLRWGTSFTQDGTHGLRGKFGGDGDQERECLSFGFLVESQSHRICRIWSRAWLVTK